MKILLDFLPLILFFATFKFAEGSADAAAAFASQHFGFLVQGGVVGASEAPVLLATLVVIAATLTQVLVLKLMRRKVDTMLWISLVLVVVLGGATVWFHNETFIKWKPSGLYWAMALTFWVSAQFFGKNLIQAMMGKELPLPNAIWKRLNWAWIGFFSFMGVLNLLVAYNFSTSTWASFKVFGSTGLILLFTIAQGLYLSPHLKEQSAPEEVAKDAAP
ncbi:MAG: septation protein A [Burkholderiaceae bacterium]|nr:septation protein A [Burkholderiaceae bacterium]MBT9501816.1 septation protein A [Burkholderiaceae bacterium]